MSHRVLVVEDEGDLLMLWRLILEREGMQVLEARGGRQGLDLARAEAPDAILLDGHLPDVSGWDVLDGLAADPALAGIPVVMVTGDTSGESKARSYRLGACRFLTKPVRAEELVGAIRRLLE